MSKDKPAKLFDPAKFALPAALLDGSAIAISGIQPDGTLGPDATWKPLGSVLHGGRLDEHFTKAVKDKRAAFEAEIAELTIRKRAMDRMNLDGAYGVGVQVDILNKLVGIFDEEVRKAYATFTGQGNGLMQLQMYLSGLAPRYLIEQNEDPSHFNSLIYSINTGHTVLTDPQRECVRSIFENLRTVGTRLEIVFTPDA
jgi:hypothetical protein